MTEATKKPKLAFLLAFLAVLFWSTSGSAFKITLRYLRPTEMLLYILPVAAIAQAAFIAWEGRWREVTQAPARDILRSIIVGFINPFLYYNVLFKGYDLLLTQEASTINFLWPIVLVVLSAPFLGQPISLKTVIALFLGFSGVAVITTKGDPFSLKFQSLTGVLLVLLSTVIWSFFWILNLTDKRNTSVKLFLNFSFGFLFNLVFWAFTMQARPPSLEGVLGCLWAGVFEMGITFFIWLKALEYAEKTSQVANLIFLTPFIALFWINLAVGEKILPSTLLGLFLIVGGIAFQRWAELSEKKKSDHSLKGEEISASTKG